MGMEAEITRLPVFDRVRRFKKGDCIIADTDEGVVIPCDTNVLLRTLETESGIQIMAETLTPHSFGVADSEARAIFRCLAKLCYNNFPETRTGK